MYRALVRLCALAEEGEDRSLDRGEYIILSERVGFMFGKNERICRDIEELFDKPFDAMQMVLKYANEHLQLLREADSELKKLCLFITTMDDSEATAIKVSRQIWSLGKIGRLFYESMHDLLIQFGNIRGWYAKRIGLLLPDQVVDDLSAKIDDHIIILLRIMSTLEGVPEDLLHYVDHISSSSYRIDRKKELLMKWDLEPIFQYNIPPEDEAVVVKVDTSSLPVVKYPICANTSSPMVVTESTPSLPLLVSGFSFAPSMNMEEKLGSLSNLTQFNFGLDILNNKLDVSSSVKKLDLLDFGSRVVERSVDAMHVDDIHLFLQNDHGRRLDNIIDYEDVKLELMSSNTIVNDYSNEGASLENGSSDFSQRKAMLNFVADKEEVVSAKFQDCFVFKYPVNLTPPTIAGPLDESTHIDQVKFVSSSSGKSSLKYLARSSNPIKRVSIWIYWQNYSPTLPSTVKLSLKYCDVLRELLLKPGESIGITRIYHEMMIMSSSVIVELDILEADRFDISFDVDIFTDIIEEELKTTMVKCHINDFIENMRIGLLKSALCIDHDGRTIPKNYLMLDGNSNIQFDNG